MKVNNTRSASPDVPRVPQDKLPVAKTNPEAKDEFVLLSVNLQNKMNALDFSSKEVAADPTLIADRCDVIHNPSVVIPSDEKCDFYAGIPKNHG